MTLTVREVALRTPVTVLPETPICEAEQQLIAREASEIYVTDHEEKLLGVVPDHEILKYRLLGGDGQGRISALMVPVTISLLPTASLDAGARLLREHIHSSVPILEGGRLIGQLCRATVLRIFAEQGYVPQVDALSISKAYLPAPKFTQFAQGTRNSRILSR